MFLINVGISFFLPYLIASRRAVRLVKDYKVILKGIQIFNHIWMRMILSRKRSFHGLIYIFIVCPNKSYFRWNRDNLNDPRCGKHRPQWVYFLFSLKLMCHILKWTSSQIIYNVILTYKSHFLKTKHSIFFSVRPGSNSFETGGECATVSWI